LQSLTNVIGRSWSEGETGDRTGQRVIWSFRKSVGDPKQHIEIDWQTGSAFLPPKSHADSRRLCLEISFHSGFGSLSHPSHSIMMISEMRSKPNRSFQNLGRRPALEMILTSNGNRFSAHLLITMITARNFNESKSRLQFEEGIL
jgi:hypothetical protein